MAYVFEPPAQPYLSIAGSDDRLPVRRIFCVGRNYAAHAREMGADPDRDPPFFFTKPADAVIAAGKDVPYPPLTSNLHYEAELIVIIGTGGRNIPIEESLSHVWGYAIGNDLTRRDLQNKAKEKGRPWDFGKAFDNSAVIGPAHPVSSVGHISSGTIRLSLNEKTRQEADLEDMIWSIPEVISILSEAMELAPGDLIMTGTPEGVGPMVEGDHFEIFVDGLGSINSRIGPAQ